MNYADLAKEMMRMWDASQEMKEAHMRLLTNPISNSVRRVWLGVYSWAVGNKLITRIEDLPQADKTELWQHTKEICRKEMSIEQMKDVSRCLLTIEYYLNQ